MNGYPKPGELLAKVVREAGFRPAFEKAGETKKLDELAKEKSPTTALKNLYECEDRAAQFLIEDIGLEWAKFLWQEWASVKADLRLVASTIVFYDPPDEGPTPREQTIHATLTVPMIARFLKRASIAFQSPNLHDWLERPLHTWIKHASKITSLSEAEIEEALSLFGNPEDRDHNQRTLRRWIAGEPMRSLSTPYRRINERLQVRLKSTEKAVPDHVLSGLAGWLCLTRAVQNMSKALRDDIDHRISSKRDPLLWSGHVFVKEILDMDETSRYLCYYYEEIPQVISEYRQLEDPDEQLKLADLFKILSNEREAPVELPSNEGDFVIKWMNAIRCANAHRETDALAAYDQAVMASWWRKGKTQAVLIDEAFVYAVGMGDRKAAKKYWNMLQLLGTVPEQEAELEDVDFYRFIYVFENRFPHLRPKSPVEPASRWPGPVTTPVTHRPGNDAIDQLYKTGNGIERRTKLIEAAERGNKGKMKDLLSIGANVNKRVKKTNMTALSAALDHAISMKHQFARTELQNNAPRGIEQKGKAAFETAIENVLTLLDAQIAPDQDTLNKPAWTDGEVPLQKAIEIGDVNIVRQMVELGADRQGESRKVPCLLMYCMTLFRNGAEEVYQDLTNYLKGDSFSDIDDLLAGALSSCGKAEFRQSSLVQGGVMNRADRVKFDAVVEKLLPNPADIRKIIEILVADESTYLSQPADPNKRTSVRRMMERFTPTLYAAELGDLQIFKTLVESGGDWTKSIYHSRGVDHANALWIAEHHQNEEIVSFLRSLR